MMFHPKHVLIKKFELQKHRMVHQSNIIMIMITIMIIVIIIIIINYLAAGPREAPAPERRAEHHIHIGK